MKKLLFLSLLLLALAYVVVTSCGCSAGFSIGPQENPYSNAHIEMVSPVR